MITCGLLSDFQYGFRSSQSTADLLKVVSDRIARSLNRSGATRTVALDTSKTFDMVWHAGCPHKLKSYEISGQIFDLISSFLSNRWLHVVLNGKSLQRYLVNSGFPPGSILGRGQGNAQSLDMTERICHLTVDKFSQFQALSGHFGNKKLKII